MERCYLFSITWSAMQLIYFFAVEYCLSHSWFVHFSLLSFIKNLFLPWHFISNVVSYPWKDSSANQQMAQFYVVFMMEELMFYCHKLCSTAVNHAPPRGKESPAEMAEGPLCTWTVHPGCAGLDGGRDRLWMVQCGEWHDSWTGGGQGERILKAVICAKFYPPFLAWTHPFLCGWKRKLLC